MSGVSDEIRRKLYSEWVTFIPVAEKIAQSQWAKNIIQHDKIDGLAIPEISRTILENLKEDYKNLPQLMDMLGLNVEYAYALREAAATNAMEIESYLGHVVCLALFIASKDEGMRQLEEQNKTINEKGVSHLIMDRCMLSYLTIALSVMVIEIFMTFIKRKGQCFRWSLTAHVIILTYVVLLSVVLLRILQFLAVFNTLRAIIRVGLHKTRLVVVLMFICYSASIK